jgi:hypothetical protein
MSKPKPTLIEVLKDIEVLLTEQGFDDFQNAHQYAFIDRLLLLKETIKSAFSVDSFLRKSPTPVPQPPPPSAGVGAAAVPPSAGGVALPPPLSPSAGGDAAPPPPPSLAADEAKVRVFNDNTYGVKRFGQQPKPFAFAQGIDALSAVVGALTCCGQGPVFANSVAHRICFQV